MVRRFRLAREEGYALRTLGFTRLKLGQFEEAAACFETAELLARRLNDTLGLAYSMNFQLELAIVRGDIETGSRLAEEVLALMGDEAALLRIPEFAHVRAKLLVAAGRRQEATKILAGLRERASAAGYRHLLAEVSALEEGLMPASPTSQPPEAELVIRCLGGLRVRRRDGEVGEREWQSARAKLLLAYLLHTPEGATKARLFEAIYPNEAPTEASMNMTLMRLRKALEPGLEKGQPSRFILRTDGRYAFNRQIPFELDSLSFERAIALARRASGADQTRAWQEALASYGGDFLPEFEAEWVVALRQRYRDWAIEACRRLLALAQDDATAQAMIERALGIDPLSEEFNRERILRHLEAEEPHRALEHYRLCEKRYREQLDMAPPEDLAALVAGL
jgi:DNA-binding SARP family transcriptional activator